MITHENGVFLLHNDKISLLLRVNAYGLLEQLHFGAPVCIADAEALTLHRPLGWGTLVLLDDDNQGSCPDEMGLAWSGSGRGDYRESPLELAGKSTDLRYVGHRILEGIAPMEGGLPQARGAEQTLEITMEQADLRL